MKKYVLIILGILAFIESSYSQQDSISYFLNDQGLSKVKFLVKGGYDPINGELSGNTEIRLGKHISAEFGLGLISLSRQTKLYNDPLPEVPSTGVGTGLKGEFRVYPYWGFYEKFYIAAIGRWNRFNGKSFKDILLGFGYQRPVKGRLTYDILAGYGVRMFKETVTIIDTYEEKATRFAFALQLKLGYAF